MFERFTEKAIKVIMLAQNESRRMGWNFVGTEQILLGLLAEGTGLAAQALTGKGITLADARTEVDKIVGKGSQVVGTVEIPFTPRSKRALELARKTAGHLGHDYVGTEHLLLGLIQEGEGVATRALENFGVDLGDLRDAVTKLIAQYATQEPNKTSVTNRSENAVPAPPPSPPAPPPTPAGTPQPAPAVETDSLPPLVGDESGNLSKAMQEEAKRLGHNFIGTEQILLGILAEDTGLATSTLKDMGVTLKPARTEVEKIIGRGSGFVAPEIGFTPRSKRVLQLGWQEASESGSHRIGSEHLLLGMLRERDGVAIRVLENLGVDLKKLEKRLRESLSAQ